MENKRIDSTPSDTGIRAFVRSGAERRRENGNAVIFDLVIFITAFLFAGCHIAFGTRPLATALLAVLPSGVWIALFGAVCGALTLGKGGVIYAIISVIVVFLRVIISGSERREGLFGEPTVLRVCSATIGAFVGAVYEVLLGSFSLASILSGGAGVLLSALFTFAFSGALDSGISLSDFISGKKNLFFATKREDKLRLILFQGTMLLFVFLISISLKEYNLIGISAAYLFSTAATLFTAKRFGPVRGMAVGFVSSLGISKLYSVAFALVGLGAGFLFEVSAAYALIGGGVLLSAWCFYCGSTLGLLGTLPEYVSASLLVFPLLRKIPRQNDNERDSEQFSRAEEMVSSAALMYKSSPGGSVEGLEGALFGLSNAFCSFDASIFTLGVEDYRTAALGCLGEICTGCPDFARCREITPAPCVENIEIIATKVYNNSPRAEIESAVPTYCTRPSAVVSGVIRATSDSEQKRYNEIRASGVSEEYSLIGKMINEARLATERERSVNQPLTDALSGVLEGVGLNSGVLKAFGERRKYFIGAALDKDGKKISAEEIFASIEDISGARLSRPEFYRRGDTALFECRALPRYAVEFASVSLAADGESVSGDTASSFETLDGRFYALISDGMGTGKTAHATSRFASELLSGVLNSSCSKTTALHLLNSIIRRSGEECSATVDLFDFDTYTGEGVFFKCGAAASYVKRDSSIFRIRSETAPIGLMKTIDAERVRVEIKEGDYIIMISDGVSQSFEDATWLFEAMAKPHSGSVGEYLDLLVGEARKNCLSTDDMTVAVAKISLLGQSA